MQPIPIITYLYNLIRSTSVSPVSWKHSLRTPIPKVTPPCDYRNLWPIYVTPILSRIYEKLFVEKIFLKAIPNNIFDDQFAFRPTGSTTAALSYLFHEATNALDYGNHIRCFHIDFSKAFNTVPHHHLLGKLVSYNCPQILINWIANYLTDRTQYVTSSSGCLLS
jgi:Reverse transcriptase (RNA-dependent DNA polymerase)